MCAALLADAPWNAKSVIAATGDQRRMVADL